METKDEKNKININYILNVVHLGDKDYFIDTTYEVGSKGSDGKGLLYFGMSKEEREDIGGFNINIHDNLLLISHSPMNHGSLPTQEKAAGEFPAAFSLGALYSLGNNFFTQNINSTPA